MPTYEYVCQKCDHPFEVVQSMSDPALKTCPKELCGMKKWGKGKVKRAIGAGAGLIFKGSGFYITDYRSENYKTGAKKDSAPAASSSSETKSSSTSESKSTPAAPAKSESKPAKTTKAKD
jgi:putative FmdB family regulatory protein